MVLGSLWVRAQIANGNDELLPEERNNIAIFEAASPSVVHIESIKVGRDFFTLNLLKIPAGSGSGFIWDDQGHVVTNFHVIEGASAAKIILSDQSSWDAKLVGAEPDKDLAVLKIEAPAEKLKALKLGASTDLLVGQSVLAIGNPFGLDQTLTTGIISGLEREIEAATGRTIQGVIQTDAAINPGNSGGPLLDSRGRLIGINTAIVSPSGAYAGVGFAVPVDVVNRLVPELIIHGHIIRPVLGIQPLTVRDIEGLVVLNVNRGGGAEAAGLRPTQRDRFGRFILGDVIVAVDGKRIVSSDDLYHVLEDYKVGDIVELTLIRDGKPAKAPLKLGPSA